MEFGETRPADATPQGLVAWCNRLLDDLGYVDLSEMRTKLFIALETAIKLGATWQREQNAAPVPMRLRCPQCNTLHIDEGEFATRPHKTHTCQSCGEHFQPALVPTVGVKFLPGCKGETAVDKMAAHLANCDRCCRSQPFSKDCCNEGQQLWQATRKTNLKEFNP